MDLFSTLVENFAVLFMDSAPWLLLGLVIAGIMHELVPVDSLKHHMGDNSIKAIAKAALIGAPLPLCSCGVIPAALGLRRSGASKSATVSFLVSTPETGIDSVSVSYALLGPVYAVFRPIAAITGAIYTGIMVKLFTVSALPAGEIDKANHKSTHSIESTVDHQASVNPSTSSCCGSAAPANDPTPQPNALNEKLKDIWQFASVKLLNDLALWLLIGLLFAAVIQTWLPHQFLTQWGDGFVAMIVMALVGIPMYICATASTPVAVGLLSAGLSPGAVLVFLLAGPATNISTMGMIAKELGKHTLVIYLFSVVSASILLGYALNFIVSVFELTHVLPIDQGEHNHNDVSAFYALSAILLAGLLVRNGWQSCKQRMFGSHKGHTCH